MHLLPASNDTISISVQHGGGMQSTECSLV